MPAAPSIDNYYIGKGKVFWTPDGGAERELGNVPEFEFTPEVEKLDHYSSQSGVRSKDRTVVTQKSASVRLVMEEWTPENLALALMGSTPTADVDGNMAFDVLAATEVRGAIRFAGGNDVGPRVDIALPLVAFQPASSISPITDEWGGIEVTGDVLLSDGQLRHDHAQGARLMVGLIDIAPAVGKGHHPWPGGRGLRRLGRRHRAAARRASRTSGRCSPGRDVGFDDLLAMGGDLVAAIIAAGTGDPGDPVAEEAAGRLGIDEQADLLAAILRVTLPKGVGPFVEKLAGLGAGLDAAGPSGTGPATTSRKRVERLIASGHPPAAAWGCTPRQLAGFLELAEARRRREAADALSIQHAARAHDAARAPQGDQGPDRMKRLKARVEPQSRARSSRRSWRPRSRSRAPRRSRSREAGDGIKADARAQIGAAGFAPQWQNALRVDHYPKGGETSIDAAAHIWHRIPYAGVFEEGASIGGSPWLWLPLDHAPSEDRPLPHDAAGAIRGRCSSSAVRASRRSSSRSSASAGQRRGRAARSRSPPRRRARRAAAGTASSAPCRCSSASRTVRLRRRFRITAIITRAAARLGELYYRHLKVDD